MRPFLKDKSAFIAVLAAAGILAYFFLLWIVPVTPAFRERVLIAVIFVGGLPMIYEILKDLLQGEWGADALAAISIVTAFVLKEYLAGSIIVLMLAGGAVLESYAVQRASSVLNALLRRSPKVAHRKTAAGLQDISVTDIQIGDRLVVFPHEITPVDGVALEGHGAMDESFLTGEPFLMSKAPGSTIFSGAINGEAALTIEATERPVDSRYAKIIGIMRAAEEKRPHLRRLGDQLGSLYTPVALVAAGIAWGLSRDPNRFLAVLVVATPCPLIIAIPIAIIGAISLSARRGIIVKNPVALEQIQLCRTAIYDKTGTLTYGKPVLVEQAVPPKASADEVLSLAASLERYSKHPLAQAIVEAGRAQRLALSEAAEISEKPGQGLNGIIQQRRVEILGRRQILERHLLNETELAALADGLECFIVIDGHYGARYRFRDAPRAESPAFIKHLGPRHGFAKQMIVSGDRAAEVHYLAKTVGITEVHAGQSPEEKLAIVRAETGRAKTLYLGDGINDGPALLAATVGIAIGENSDVASEAASVVVMESSLRRVDEFIHISSHMRKIALQCGVGGMVLSLIAMTVASLGYLPVVAGAITQEIIDLLAIANALRAALPPRVLTDV